MKIIIKKVFPIKDIAELHSIADFSFDDENILSEYYDDCFDKSSIYVIKAGKKIVGKIEIFKAFKKSRGFYAVLRRLVVMPEYRNEKFGTRLLKFSFSEAQKMGCKEVEGNVDSSNKFLLKLYKKLGLIPIRKETIVAKKLS